MPALPVAAGLNWQSTCGNPAGLRSPCGRTPPLCCRHSAYRPAGSRANRSTGCCGAPQGVTPQSLSCQRRDFRTSPSNAPDCSIPWPRPCRSAPSATASGAPMHANSPPITTWSSSRTVLTRLCARLWPAGQAMDVDRLASLHHRRRPGDTRRREHGRSAARIVHRHLPTSGKADHLVRRTAGTHSRRRSAGAPGAHGRRGSRAPGACASHSGTGVDRVARRGRLAAPAAASRQHCPGRRRSTRHAAHARSRRVPVPRRRHRARRRNRR